MTVSKGNFFSLQLWQMNFRGMAKYMVTYAYTWLTAVLKKDKNDVPKIHVSCYFPFFFFEFTFGKISCCLKFYQICFSLLTRFLLIIDVTMHSVHRWHHEITQPYLVWDNVCKVRVLCFEKWKRYGVGGITFLYSLVNHMQILHPLFFSKLELIKNVNASYVYIYQQISPQKGIGNIKEVWKFSVN